MNQTMKRIGLLAVLLAAASLTACDPYPSENTSGAQVTGARIIDASFSGAVEPVNGTGANGAWSVGTAAAPVSIASLNPDPTDPKSAAVPALVIQLNQLLGDNAVAIEPTPGECGALTATSPISVTPAGAWVACYYPSSGSPELGPSIVVFQGDGTDWSSATLPAGTIHVTGNIATVRGAAPVDVTAYVAP